MSERTEHNATSDERRLYGDLSWTWRIISPPEHYIEEAEEVVTSVRKHARGHASTLLHLGCGGGHLDHTLKRHLGVTGVDTSREMLALAADLNPDVRYVLGDMREITLHHTFDAVLIADSIGYMSTEEDLLAAFRTAYVHLRDGGVFITYAEDTTERFVQNSLTISTGRSDDVEIALIENSYDPNPTDTAFDYTLVYLIRRQGELSVEVDRHLAGLFPRQTWENVLLEAGFEIVEMSESTDAIDFICLRP